MFEINGKKYRSFKHPMLEVIFQEKNPSKDTRQEVIPFTLKDISAAYKKCGIPEPASISNTILDLTRKVRPIESRLPKSIYSLGYDLRKRTGTTPENESYAGEFVYVGVGKTLASSFFEWPTVFEEHEISSAPIPAEIRALLRNDEAALFSVMDYCDVLSHSLSGEPKSILRVQHPMKWQPNEIDGFYFGTLDGKKYVFPVEAKALTTEDDINMEQLGGGLRTVSEKLRAMHQFSNLQIKPLAIKMIHNGLLIAVFKSCRVGSETVLEFDKAHRIRFSPEIHTWRAGSSGRRRRPEDDPTQIRLVEMS